jgi:hypothetical protein
MECRKFLWVFVSLLLTWSWPAYSLTYQSSDMNYQITHPSDWRTKAYREGSDIVYDAMNRSEDILVRIRSISLSPGKPAFQILAALKSAFRTKKRNGAAPVRVDDLRINGQYFEYEQYRWNHNGIQIAQENYYTATEGNAHILSTVLPVNKIDQHSDQVAGIIRSFHCPSSK